VFVRKIPDDIVQRLLDVFLQRHTDDAARRYSSDFLLWLLCVFFPEVADVLSQEEPKVFVPRRWDEDYTKPDVLEKRVEDSQKRVEAWRKSVEVTRERLDYFSQWFSDDFLQRFLDVLLQRPTDDFSQWLSDIAKWDNDATQKFWDEYYKRLVGLARQNLEGFGVSRSDYDEEDVAGDVMLAFFRRMKKRPYTKLHTRNNLRNLLFTITVRKAKDRWKRCCAQKRGGGWVQVHEKSSPKTQPTFASIAALGLEVKFDDKQDGLNGLLHRKQLTPEQAASYNEDFIRRLKQLPDDSHRLIMLMIMAKFSVQEIAGGLGCVRQTVYNKLKTIWNKKLDYMPVIDPKKDVMNDAIQEYQSQLVLTEDNGYCLRATNWLNGDTLRKMTKELRDLLKSSATHLDASQFFEE
jgi:DNA-directed RNA polymerase specialized sigma24 family protein